MTSCLAFFSVNYVPRSETKSLPLDCCFFIHLFFAKADDNRGSCSKHSMHHQHCDIFGALPSNEIKMKSFVLLIFQTIALTEGYHS